MKRKNDGGFTLLEVMVAVGIFGIMMLAISQMMRAEISLFNSENNQNQYEQKARTAMNQILDQVRLNGYVTFVGDGGYDDGFYAADPAGTKCLLNVNPDPGERFSGNAMYYDPDKAELWFQEDNKQYLIADDLTILEVQGVTAHLAMIRVVAGDPASDTSFELITWARLY